VKIRVFVFESFEVLNLYFNLIGESVEKILGSHGGKFENPWVFSHGMSPLKPLKLDSQKF
jgi:hypothetical protein